MKLDFIKKFYGIENSNIIIEEQTSKRGCVSFVANRMVFTSTVRTLKNELLENGLSVSVGSILNCKPFFITYVSEKEMMLCLCKICLNTKFLFDPLMVKAKKDGDETHESISSFFMANCKCEKSPNGYYQWNCSRRSCKTCKDCKPAELKCQTSNEIVSVDQFEVVTKEYLKFNKKTEEVEKKSTKLTDRVSSQMTYKDLYKKLKCP